MLNKKYTKRVSRHRRAKGVKRMPRHRITTRRIPTDKILGSLKDESTGATVVFVGTVRNRSEDRRVEKLFYESYIGMAEKNMSKIEDLVLKKWPIKKIKMIHRIGRLSLGDASLVVAVSSPHREEAFEACRYAIEKIKHEVPIWKKEKIAGGREEWVKGLTRSRPTYNKNNKI